MFFSWLFLLFLASYGFSEAQSDYVAESYGPRSLEKNGKEIFMPYGMNFDENTYSPRPKEKTLNGFGFSGPFAAIFVGNLAPYHSVPLHPLLAGSSESHVGGLYRADQPQSKDIKKEIQLALKKVEEFEKELQSGK